MGTINITVDFSAMQVETLTITVLAKEGRSMAHKLVTKKAVVKKTSAVPTKAAAKKTSAAPKTSKAVLSRSRIPAATIRALKELKAGELTRYADADDLFKKLGIKLGKD
jgi:hypothetical protein